MRWRWPIWRQIRPRTTPSLLEAFLLGLLHNAADWLRSCGPRISLARSENGCLPNWLVTVLRQRSRPPRTEPVQQVMRAIALGAKRGGKVGAWETWT